MPQINTDKAPAAIGPYSQAIAVGETIYTSGQIGLDPTTGKLVEGGVEAQTRQVLKNLGAILEAAGSGYAQVVKTTCFLADMNDFTAFNEIYGECFQTHPARECVQAAALPAGALVEVSAIAVTAHEHFI